MSTTHGAKGRLVLLGVLCGLIAWAAVPPLRAWLLSVLDGSSLIAFALLVAAFTEESVKLLAFWAAWRFDGRRRWAPQEVFLLIVAIGATVGMLEACVYIYGWSLQGHPVSIILAAGLIRLGISLFFHPFLLLVAVGRKVRPLRISRMALRLSLATSAHWAINMAAVTWVG